MKKKARTKMASKTKTHVRVSLGDRVRDAYTKFEGIATARCEYLYGCTQITITPEEMTKDGKFKDAHWFDEQRVELVKRLPIVQLAPQVETGGPQAGAPKPGAPSGRLSPRSR